ncbi:MAG: 2-oxoacid:acceptor oxidoreductase family protein [Chloroflexota bacterium]
MVEIRWHGRGGQGAVTSAGLLAEAAIDEGKYAQAFPSFGPERRGAPVAAYVRIDATKPIRVRAEVLQPDVVIVFDAGLLRSVPVALGLKERGMLILNTRKSPEEIQHQFGGSLQVAVVDASKIAMEVLGVPIVNTTMVGALLKATGIVKLDSLLEPLQHRFGKLAGRNIDAMKRAYAETRVRCP